MTHFAKSLIAVCLLCVTSLCAGGQSSPAYTFLDIPSSSKVYGLGGVNVSLVGEDIMTVEQNPALLGPEMSGELGLNYMRYIAGTNLAGVAYGHSAGERGAWSTALRYFSYGSMTETDPDGNITGEFSAKDLSVSATYSHDITDRLRGGATINYLYSAYAGYTAMALATNLGVNYYDDDRDLSLSAVVVNLGGQIKKFDNHYDRLPIDVRLGWSKTFGSLPIRFSVTAWNLTKWKLPYYKLDPDTDSYEKKDSFTSNLFRHLVFAADFVGSDNFYLGLGYNYKTRTDMATYHRSFLSGLSLAAGLRVKAFGVGIAFAQPHTGATTFMVNLTASLSELIH